MSDRQGRSHRGGHHGEHDHDQHGGHEHGGGNDRARVPGEHKARAPRSAKVYVVTCSDSRTEATDEGGRILRETLQAGGHEVTGSAIVPDDPARITAELDRARASGAQFALVTGGTGLSSRDSTFEALSRALAGQLGNGLFVFAMPGSPAAVRLACEKLIIPELGHVLEELSR